MQSLVSLLPTRQQIVRLGLAGLAGFIVWELYSKGVLPALFGNPLDPTGLILKVFGLGKEFKSAAFGLHVLTGVVAYPVAFYVLIRGIRSFGPVADGLVLGLATWVFAAGIMTPLAGAGFFGGFALWVWKSLVGHLLYGLTVSLVFNFRRKVLVQA